MGGKVKDIPKLVEMIEKRIVALELKKVDAEKDGRQHDAFAIEAIIRVNKKMLGTDKAGEK